MRRLLTALILGAALMVFFGNALAGEKAYVPKDNEELYGMWVNMDYKTGDPPQKLTYKSDGTIYSSIYAESAMLLWKTKFQITGKWKDSEVNIWYKGHWLAESGEEGYSLYKISNSGKTCEYIFNHNECPTKVDTEHRNYRIYYRKAEEMAKEGSTSGRATWIVHFTLLPMGKERVQINYEGYGVAMSDTGEGLLHNASAHVVGSIHAFKGRYEDDSGFICYTRPDGDQIFTTYKCTGIVGKTGKGTVTYVGGTGNFVGLQGSGKFTRLMLRPPAKGVGASLAISKSNWKIVEAKK